MNEKQYSKNNISPIDCPSVLERIGGDESFLEELLNLYCEDFSEKFEQLQKAVKEENIKLILELGHSLKGSSANLSLTFLHEASFQMEKAGREKNIENAKEALDLLEKEFRILKDFISKKKA